MGVCLEPSNLCIITELMSRGSLYDVLNNPDIDLSFSVKIKLALDTLRGLQFVHSAGFLHRDLKSPNLLVDKSWNIKIADFGLSVGKGHAASNAQVSLLWTAPVWLRFSFLFFPIFTLIILNRRCSNTRTTVTQRRVIFTAFLLSCGRSWLASFHGRVLPLQLSTLLS